MALLIANVRHPVTDWGIMEPSTIIAGCVENGSSADPWWREINKKAYRRPDVVGSDVCVNSHSCISRKWYITLMTGIFYPSTVFFICNYSSLFINGVRKLFILCKLWLTLVVSSLKMLSINIMMMKHFMDGPPLWFLLPLSNSRTFSTMRVNETRPVIIPSYSRHSSARYLALISACCCDSAWWPLSGGNLKTSIHQIYRM